jgi:chromosomal replication initiator protein
MNNVENYNLSDLWRAVLGQLELNVSPNLYNSFLMRTNLDDMQDTEATIACEDAFVMVNVEKKLKSDIENALLNIAGASKNLKFIVKKTEKKVITQAPDPGPLFKHREESEVIKDRQQKSNLSPRFTFENLILGKHNNLAYAIATAVSERPGEQYNPVFIHSGVGLGKTHLLQAIGNKIIQNKPATKVIYATGESFMNELIEAIQSGKSRGKYTTNEFRNKYRRADVFLIDDIQFIIGRESTQDEFFHTFNDLYMSQKQIVITSDRPPKEFNNLAARITSRFASGIIVDIQTPDFETRAAILRTRRDRFMEEVPNNVIDFIAERVTANVRELEGAYMQVVTQARASGQEATLELAAHALGQSARETKNLKSINVNDILKAVCTYYSIKMQDIKGKKRNKEIVIPRQIAMYLIKEITDAPFMSIGDFLGGRDHTTIMHGTEKVAHEVQIKEGKTHQDVINIRTMLGA